jgi:hypothetical protein
MAIPRPPPIIYSSFLVLTTAYNFTNFLQIIFILFSLNYNKNNKTIPTLQVVHIINVKNSWIYNDLTYLGGREELYRKMFLFHSIYLQFIANYRGILYCGGDWWEGVQFRE